MPAVIAVLSPWKAVTENEDTYFTLKEDDPALIYDPWLKNSTEAYTNITHKNPMYLTFIVILVRDFHQR